MAKKENGRELLRQDNESLRKQFVDCRKLLEEEREKSERRKILLDTVHGLSKRDGYVNIVEYLDEFNKD